jgi:hypothetical protein
VEIRRTESKANPGKEFLKIISKSPEQNGLEAGLKQ